MGLEHVGIEVDDLAQREVALLRHPSNCTALARTHRARRVDEPRVPLRLARRDDALDHLVLVLPHLDLLPLRGKLLVALRNIGDHLPLLDVSLLEFGSEGLILLLKLLEHLQLRVQGQHAHVRCLQIRIKFELFPAQVVKSLVESTNSLVRFLPQHRALMNQGDASLLLQVSL